MAFQDPKKITDTIYPMMQESGAALFAISTKKHEFDPFTLALSTRKDDGTLLYDVLDIDPEVCMPCKRRGRTRCVHAESLRAPWLGQRALRETRAAMMSDTDTELDNKLNAATRHPAFNEAAVRRALHQGRVDLSKTEVYLIFMGIDPNANGPSQIGITCIAYTDGGAQAVVRRAWHTR